MLPSALQRSEAPAEPLPREPPQGVRGFGVRHRVVRVGDSPPPLEEREGEVLILGERLLGKAARGKDEGATPRADRARDHRDAVQQGERPPVSVTTATVRSVDPSSRTRISRSGYPCDRSDCTVRAMTPSSLYAGTTTLTVGRPAAPAPSAPRRANGRRRRWRIASASRNT